MGELNQPQRRAVIVLGVMNLLAFVGLGAILLRSSEAPSETLTASPLTPERVEACRQATSDALFSAGHIGMVSTYEDGRIVIQLQRPLPTDRLRSDADGAVWAALEAISSGGECLRFTTVQVAVDYSSPIHNGLDQCLPGESTSTEAVSSAQDCQRSRAIANASMADLLLWSLGEIDDAELSRRLDYDPPPAFSRNSSESTATP